ELVEDIEDDGFEELRGHLGEDFEKLASGRGSQLRHGGLQAIVRARHGCCCRRGPFRWCGGLVLLRNRAQAHIVVSGCDLFDDVLGRASLRSDGAVSAWLLRELSLRGTPRRPPFSAALRRGAKRGILAPCTRARFGSKTDASSSTSRRICPTEPRWSS